MFTEKKVNQFMELQIIEHNKKPKFRHGIPWLSFCTIQQMYKLFSVLLVFTFFETSIAQVADAGNDQVICASHTILDGNNPGVGTGTWSVKVGSGQGSFVDPNVYDTEVQDAGFGPKVYIWELDKGGTVTTDEVVITSWASQAGNDQVVCADSAVLQACKPSDIPGGATGVWTTTGGATIDDPTSYTTTVRNLDIGDNYFKWTITYTDPNIFDDPASCASTHDEVKITYTGVNLINHTLTGDTIYCAGGTGVELNLSGSELNVNYQLYKDGATFGAAIPGDGNPLDWNNNTEGTYYVEAYSTVQSCIQEMSGEIEVTQYASLTSFNVGGTSSYCAGSSGKVSLSGSELGVDYQLIRNAVSYGLAKVGTGSALEWTGLPDGTYTVKANDGNCTKMMNGSLTITVDLLPVAYNVSGTGSYCEGTSGLSVTLDNSENGIKYYLQKSGSRVDSTFSTGGAITWNDNLVGTYTVEALNTSTGCSRTMNGSAILSENPLPLDKNLSAPAGYCEGGTGVSIVLNASQVGISYQLVKNGANHLAPKSGTGGNLTWGSQLSGTYWVVATNTLTTCSAHMPDTITIVEFPLPPADAGPDESVCLGSATTLSATGGTSYLWLPGGYAGQNYTVNPGTDTEYVVKVTDANGCVNRDTLNVTVNSLPTVNAGGDEQICNGKSIQLNATGGVTYNWSPVAGLNFPNIQSPVASPANTTDYMVTATDANGCENYDVVRVTVMSNPVANAGTDVDICDGDTTTLTANGGGTYLWSTGETTSSIKLAPGSTTTYYVTVENTNGCTDVDDVVVNVFSVPTANAGPDKEICEGQNSVLNASGGNTYLWSNGSATQSITVTPIDTTTYTVTAISAAGCEDEDDITVFVNPNPTANAGPDQEICEGESTVLTSTGGTSFLWSPTGDVTASITVNPMVTTDYSVVVKDDNNCTDSDQVRVIVNPLPVVSIYNLEPDYCADEPDVNITGIPTGGTGTFSATSGLTDNLNGTAVFSPTSVPNGTSYNITYTYTDGNGCVNDATSAVYVRNETSPNPAFDNLEAVYCDDDNTNYLITATPGDNNGSFSGPGGGAFTDNNDGTATFNPSMLSIGTYSVSYTYVDPVTLCEGSTSQSVEVGVPMSITNLDPIYCEDVGPFILTADRAGGEFKIDGVYSGPQGTATFDPSTIGSGIHTVTYEITNGISCSNSSTVQTEVIALPDASFTLDGVSNASTELKYCENNGLVTLQGDPNPGGTFSCATGGVSGNKFNPDAVSVGAHKIYYSYTTAEGCTNVDSATVYVEEVPTVDITGLANAYCNDVSTVSIAGNPLNSGGTTPVPGTWTVPWGDATIFNDNGDGTAEFTPSNVPLEGTYSITYSVSGSNGCLASVTRTVDVNFLPTVTFTGLPTEICKNADPVTLTGNPEDGNGSFTGPLASVSDNSDGTATFDPSSLATISHNITYAYTHPITGCTDSKTRSIMVKPLPALYSVTGGGSYCENGTGVHVGLSGSEAGVDYKLVLDGIDTLATLTGDGNPLDFGLQVSEGTYTVIAFNPAPNNCTLQMTGNTTVTTDPLPDDAQPITGKKDVCPLEAVAYQVPAITDATGYTWTLPSGATITSGSGTRSVTIFYGSGASSGVLSVKGNNACGSGSTSQKNITLLEVPSAAGAITGNDLVCREETVNYSVGAIADADFYLWSLPPGADIESGDSTTNIVVKYDNTALSGNIRVKGENTCGLGTESALPVSVVPLPDVSTFR